MKATETQAFKIGALVVQGLMVIIGALLWSLVQDVKAQDIQQDRTIQKLNREAGKIEGIVQSIDKQLELINNRFDEYELKKR